ncbi:uncharacterized protein EAF01_008647 [Botrytis porri]|uniref:uncharacterized protein n=1 Tax=Botrytis porri TaxID=87229 RepID=UPI0018FF1F0E|nr:uncharacterized protein EAF01_008647 [Botrytis porri]KAF7897681.1 hypothetical protein EAF01_008647 [Botrytis porri]
MLKSLKVLPILIRFTLCILILNEKNSHGGAAQQSSGVSYDVAASNVAQIAGGHQTSHSSRSASIKGIFLCDARLSPPQMLVYPKKEELGLSLKGLGRVRSKLALYLKSGVALPIQ